MNFAVVDASARISITGVSSAPLMALSHFHALAFGNDLFRATGTS